MLFYENTEHLLSPACQIAHPYQSSLETTFIGNNNLDSILKFDLIISVIELFFFNNDSKYKQIAYH